MVPGAPPDFDRTPFGSSDKKIHKPTLEGADARVVREVKKLRGNSVTNE